MVGTLISSARKALDIIGDTFSPPKDASSREIRVNGALCLAAAVGCLALSGLGLLALNAALPQSNRFSARMLMMPAILFSVLAIFGSYRLIVGKSPEAAYPGELSAKRVLLAVCSILAVFAVILGIAFIIDRLA